MVSFTSDYICGAHPEVLKALIDTNAEILEGYECDSYCLRAAEKIKAACACPEAEVFFLAGGTQTNQVVISTVLRNYEGVLSAATGHVNVHEAGAIEYTGHKVLALPEHEGKIDAGELRAWLRRYYADGSYDHMVFPGMVYISFPTEYGTLYSKQELSGIYDVCREYEIPLYIDGARLAYGLASPAADVTLSDIARLCDVFYIGGTKVGALCGEAVVFTHGNAPRQFITQVKQHGAMLAKGRLLGVQFDALFTDDLYLRIGRHAVSMAEKLEALLRSRGLRFYLETPTNQKFIILENEEMRRLSENVGMSFWDAYDDRHTVLRLATGWSTTEEEIEELGRLLK